MLKQLIRTILNWTILWAKSTKINTSKCCVFFFSGFVMRRLCVQLQKNFDRNQSNFWLLMAGFKFQITGLQFLTYHTHSTARHKLYFQSNLFPFFLLASKSTVTSLKVVVEMWKWLVIAEHCKVWNVCSLCSCCC